MITAHRGPSRMKPIPLKPRRRRWEEHDATLILVVAIAAQAMIIVCHLIFLAEESAWHLIVKH